MSTATHFASPDNVISTKLEEDEVVLLNLDTKQYFSLNETGTRIWGLIEAGTTLASVLETLKDEYSGEPDAIERFVQSFVDDLKSEGLIVEREDVR